MWATTSYFRRGNSIPSSAPPPSLPSSLPSSFFLLPPCINQAGPLFGQAYIHSGEVSEQLCESQVNYVSSHVSQVCIHVKVRCLEATYMLLYINCIYMYVPCRICCSRGALRLRWGMSWMTQISGLEESPPWVRTRFTDVTLQPREPQSSSHTTHTYWCSIQVLLYANSTVSLVSYMYIYTCTCHDWTEGIPQNYFVEDAKKMESRKKEEHTLCPFLYTSSALSR